MNLHAIAGPIISTVNPARPATVQVNTGYTTSADGTRTATFTTVNVIAQIQALSYMDLQMTEGLVLNGERRSIYLFGAFNSANRPGNTGSDLVTFADGTVWVIAQVTEQWPDWCKVIVTRQVV